MTGLIETRLAGLAKTLPRPPRAIGSSVCGVEHGGLALYQHALAGNAPVAGELTLAVAS